MFLLMIRRAENLSKEADDAHTRRLAGKDTGRNSRFKYLDSSRCSGTWAVGAFCEATPRVLYL